MKNEKYKPIEKVPRLNAELRMRHAAVLVSTNTVGNRIKLARTHKEMTQTELANQIGTIYQRIHEWESDWKNPSYKYLEKIGAVLDVSAEWLRTGLKTEEPRFIYDQSYPNDLSAISDEQYEKRKSDLLKAGDEIISVSAETLDHLVIVLERLSGIDFILHSPSVKNNEPVNKLYFSEEKEAAFQKSWQYIKNKIEDNNDGK